MTDPVSALTAPDRTLLNFLSESDRYLYDFLDHSHFPTYQQARLALNRLITRGWVASGWSDGGAIIYRLTDLGRECLRTGLQLETMPERKSPFWMTS